MRTAAIRTRAAVHCASCARRFEVDNPVGIVVLNQAGSEYHIALEADEPIGGEYFPVTVCGKFNGFDSRIGAVGMQLSEHELTHEWLRTRDACRECFALVW